MKRIKCLGITDVVAFALIRLKDVKQTNVVESWNCNVRMDVSTFYVHCLPNTEIYETSLQKVILIC